MTSESCTHNEMHIICFYLSSFTSEFLGYKYVGVSSYFSFILLFYLIFVKRFLG